MKNLILINSLKVFTLRNTPKIIEELHNVLTLMRSDTKKQQQENTHKNTHSHTATHTLWKGLDTFKARYRQNAPGPDL